MMTPITPDGELDLGGIAGSMWDCLPERGRESWLYGKLITLEVYREYMQETYRTHFRGRARFKSNPEYYGDWLRGTR